MSEECIKDDASAVAAAPPHDWSLNANVDTRAAFLNQLGEGVILTNKDGEIVFVNDLAKQLHGQAPLGVGPDGYTATYNLLTMDGDPSPVEQLPLTRAVRDGEVVIDERWRIRRSDGSEILAIGSARPVHGRDGQQVGAVLTIRDDTRRHADEQALKDLIRTKDILLHEVNHRVKNSLQLVTSLLSLQAARTDDPQVRQGLDDASLRIAVVARIHQRLYTTSEHDRIDIGTWLQEVAQDNVRAHAPDGGLHLVTECDELIVEIDQAVPLALCVSELLVNAMKYAPVGRTQGTIRLRVASLADGSARIDVEDDGNGLPQEFDLDQSTGLGMKIVQALARQLRATLSVESAPGRTCFTISLIPRRPT